MAALAAATGATIVRPEPVDVDLPGYQRTNFARRAAAAAPARCSAPRRRTSSAASLVACPGRFQVVAHDPLTIVDGAHNAPGIAALAELRARRHRRGRVNPG